MPPSLKIPKFQFFNTIRQAYPSASIYLVGGAVRDLILKRAPIIDWDFVVTNVPISDLVNVLKTIGKVNLVGKRFGVIKFTPKDAPPGFIPIDIALPRKEKSINFSGKRQDFTIDSNPAIPIEEDLSRRDFTINAMAYDLKKKQIIDARGGMRDLKKRKICCVRDAKERFREDYSRMLRAVRFACQLNFEIDKKTFLAIQKLSPSLKNRQALPTEVAAAEFCKAFAADPTMALTLFEETKILKTLFPEIFKLKTNKLKMQDGSRLSAFEFVQRVFHDIARRAEKNSQKPLSLYIILAYFFLFDKQAPELARNFCEIHRLSYPQSFGISGEKLEWLLKSFGWIQKHRTATRFTDLERLFFSPLYPSADLDYFLQTFDAICCPLLKDCLPVYKNIKKALKQLPKVNGKLPPRLIDGNDLYQKFKVAPGEEIAYYLDMLREKQLKNEIRTRPEALKYLSLVIPARAGI